jgi:imidazolonepropionase-like amidohydrolase
MKLRSKVLLAALAIMGCATTPATHAQSQSQAPKPTAVLFENVRIFNGASDRLSAPQNVLVVGNVIRTISTAPIAAPPEIAVMRIAGDGRTLMPGLIDAHTHIMFETLTQEAVLTADLAFVTAVAVKGANDMLLRGFTSVRDLGGPVLGLKRAIDMGVVPGPRIWPSGAMISQTGGHGDFRLPNELPAPPGSFSFSERIGAAAIADDAETVRKRAREQLALGASQLKLMAGGGVGSSYDPRDVTHGALVHAGRGVEDGNLGQCRTAGAFRRAEPLRRQARRRPGRRPRRPAAGRWRPDRQHQSG